MRIAFLLEGLWSASLWLLLFLELSPQLLLVGDNTFSCKQQNPTQDSRSPRKSPESHNWASWNKACFRDRTIPGLKHCLQDPESLLSMPWQYLQTGTPIHSEMFTGSPTHTSHSGCSKVEWESLSPQNSQGTLHCLPNWLYLSHMIISEPIIGSQRNQCSDLLRLNHSSYSLSLGSNPYRITWLRRVRAGVKWSRNLWSLPLSLSSLCLPSVHGKTFREVRICRNKGKPSKGTK